MTTPLETRAATGGRAQEILENEVFQETFSTIEQDIVDQWKSSNAGDQAGREKLHLQLSMLHRVKAQIISTMETGKLAGLEIEAKRSTWERLRNGIGL